MNGQDFLAIRNSLNRARWAWRWHLQGGSKHWAARPLRDLRNEEELRQCRVIELKRKHLMKRMRKQLQRTRRDVINLAHERFERIRRKARTSL